MQNFSHPALMTLEEKAERLELDAEDRAQQQDLRDQQPPPQRESRRGSVVEGGGSTRRGSIVTADRGSVVPATPAKGVNRRRSVSDSRLQSTMRSPLSLTDQIDEALSPLVTDLTALHGLLSRADETGLVHPAVQTLSEKVERLEMVRAAPCRWPSRPT